MVGIQERLQQLVSMSGHQLRTEWQQAFRAEPPSGLTRDLLIRAIAYRLQERATGGLSQACKRTLRSLADQTSGEGALGALKLTSALAPGVRLVRDWGGQAHTVRVLETGFEYRGERYRSLTEIARRITGARWSGPRFFGVAKEGATTQRSGGDGAALGGRGHRRGVKAADGQI